jgi:hypothetical protein
MEKESGTKHTKSALRTLGGAIIKHFEAIVHVRSLLTNKQDFARMWTPELSAACARGTGVYGQPKKTISNWTFSIPRCQDHNKEGVVSGSS